MALFKFYFLSALICGVLVLGQPADPPTTELPTIIEVNPTTAPITTTTEPTTTTPTTTTPITTTTPTTTTTTAPTTTTQSTTTSTTTTTTPPTTTTTAPPAPPKPVGPPDQGLWSYTSDKNVTCVVVQFAAQLNVTYPGKDSAQLLHAILNVPANATVTGGNCADEQQWLTIGWPASALNNSLTVVFVKNDTTKTYELVTLNATIDSSMLPNITNVASVNLYHGKEWQTPLSSSYRCTAPTELKLVSADESSVAATLTVSRLQEEAFRIAAGKGFSAARDCAGGDIPDAVPIAVGCALGGMVVVVLIAYLVARRRSAARGYLSM